MHYRSLVASSVLRVAMKGHRVLSWLRMERENSLLVCFMSSPQWALCVGCSLQYLSSEDQLCNCLGSLCSRNTSYHPASAALSSGNPSQPPLGSPLTIFISRLIRGRVCCLSYSQKPLQSLSLLHCRRLVWKRTWDFTLSTNCSRLTLRLFPWSRGYQSANRERQMHAADLRTTGS